MTSNKKTPRLSVPFSHSQEFLSKIFREVGMRQGWWTTNRPVILAISGGSDSMALLWMFHSLWDGRIVLAHLNHGIRGKSSDEDQEFVERMAKSYGLPLVSEFLPVPELLRRGESLEDGARRVRYDFLERAMISEGAWGVAVAHTSDDSVETFLMNLLRGTGIRGLIGIPERRGPFFRPLLGFSKDFLREILQYHHIPWREDPSNLDNKFTRNRVRNRLLPFLKREFNPRIQEGLLGITEEMTSLRQEAEDTQYALLPLLRRKIPFASYACSLDSLRRLDDRTLSLFLRGVGNLLGLRTLSRERTTKLCRLIRSSSRWCFQWQKEVFLFCSFRLVAWVDPDILVHAAGKTRSLHPLEGTKGSFEWWTWRFSWSRECASESIYGTMGAVFPDAGSIETVPLSSFGMRPFSINFPEWARSLFPVLLSGTNRWIPFWEGRRSGVPIDHGIRITASVSCTLLRKEKVTD